MPNSSNDEGYASAGEGKDSRKGLPGAVQVGLIAAASAVVGGIAVAWWHRKTLQKLQNPIADPNIPDSGYWDGDHKDSELDG